MKLTVNLRNWGPQYFAVKTAIRMGSLGALNLPRTAAVGPMAGAFAGLISRAVLAAFTSSDLGSVLIRQPTSIGDFVFGMLFWLFFV
jgi:hypothetical protein